MKWVLVIAAICSLAGCSDTPARQAEEPQLERGKMYHIQKSFIGVTSLDDKEELIKTVQAQDTEHVMTMILQRRAAAVNAGETAKLIDRDGILDVWVQVRVAGRSRVWVPRSVIY